MLHGQNLVADLAERTEINVRILTAGRTDVVQLNLLKGPLTGSGLLGLGSIGGEALDEFLQLLNLLFLLAVGFLHLFDNQLAGLHPEVVVSCVQLDFPIVNVSYLGTDLIQEITVMGYHDNGVLKVNQKLLQPRNGVQVQVVGRLIQKQNVRVAEQGLGKKHLYLLSAQKGAHLRIVQVRLNAKSV